MDRRHFLAAVASAGTSLVAGGAQANEAMVGPPGPMGQLRRVWVDNPPIVKQSCPLWCWAAAISMIFASRNHPTDQMRIVNATFGGPVCTTSGHPATIPGNLSRTWTDDLGAQFTSRVVAAYDPLNNVRAINNDFIIDELRNNRPLLYCNRTHAMVLVWTDFFATPMGSNVVGGGVLDPMPGIPDFHPLTQRELYPLDVGGDMTFLGAVRIS